MFCQSLRRAPRGVFWTVLTLFLSVTHPGVYCFTCCYHESISMLLLLTASISIVLDCILRHKLSHSPCHKTSVFLGTVTEFSFLVHYLFPPPTTHTQEKPLRACSGVGGEGYQPTSSRGKLLHRQVWWPLVFLACSSQYGTSALWTAFDRMTRVQCS